MSLLLDTMVVSELRRATDSRADPEFASWAASSSIDTAFISVITIHELERGILLAERKDPAKAAVYRKWLRVITATFDGRLLVVDHRVAQAAAAFHVPDPAPFADALIAATAFVHRLTVVTRNTSDFARFGLPQVNPWRP